MSIFPSLHHPFPLVPCRHPGWDHLPQTQPIHLSPPLGFPSVAPGHAGTPSAPGTPLIQFSPRILLPGAAPPHSTRAPPHCWTLLKAARDNQASQTLQSNHCFISLPHFHPAWPTVTWERALCPFTYTDFTDLGLKVRRSYNSSAVIPCPWYWHLNNYKLLQTWMPCFQVCFSQMWKWNLNQSVCL